MQYYAESNIGCLRKLNEDSYCCGTTRDGSGFYFAVADGMGGQNAGEVASAIAIELCNERLPNTKDTDVKTSSKQLNEIMEKANRRILLTADKNIKYSGMGATAVIGVVDEENILTVANAGDCRIYLASRGELKRMTTDHTYVASLVESGIINEEQANRHPNRNVVTKALGIDEVVEADIFKYQLAENDRLLICSDGLYEMVCQEDIDKIFNNKENDCEKVCEKLIEKALNAGGIDNITVIVAEVV